MIELLSSLSPEQQAIVAGAAVSVVMWAGRFLAKAWFADESNRAKVKKLILSGVLAGFAAVALQISQGGGDASELIVAWLICWVTSQGAHNAARRVSGG